MTKKKYEKPLYIDMLFDEAVERLSSVKKDEIANSQGAKTRALKQKSKKRDDKCDDDKR